jgi:transcriptional regulator with XRE-family HTH domain
VTISYDEIASRLAPHRGDWLRKALEVSNVSARDMADYIDVSTRTMTNYLSGATTPNDRKLAKWALKCGVPVQYLKTGVVPDGEPGPGAQGELPEKSRTGNLHREVIHVDFGGKIAA